MSEVFTIALLLIGAVLILIASIGLLRMPDLYLRMSASTKASTVGVASLLIAAAFHFWELGVTTQMIATMLFLLLTAPVGAHIIGRTAYRKNKVTLYERTVTDELQHYSHPKHPQKNRLLPK